MTTSQPIMFILHHKTSILPVYCRQGKKARETWDCLKEVLPEMQRVMKFNTFKQYISVIASVEHTLNTDDQEEGRVRQNVSNPDEFRVPGLDRVRQNGSKPDEVRQQLDNPPKRILGWNVRKSKDGYYRCYRKIANQVHSIYLGKHLDVDKAAHQIKEKEQQMKLDNS